MLLSRIFVIFTQIFNIFKFFTYILHSSFNLLSFKSFFSFFFFAFVLSLHQKKVDDVSANGELLQEKQVLSLNKLEYLFSFLRRKLLCEILYELFNFNV